MSSSKKNFFEHNFFNDLIFHIDCPFSDLCWTFFLFRWSNNVFWNLFSECVFRIIQNISISFSFLTLTMIDIEVIFYDSIRCRFWLILINTFFLHFSDFLWGLSFVMACAVYVINLSEILINFGKKICEHKFFLRNFCENYFFGKRKIAII